jgi:hypothetical protein
MKVTSMLLQYHQIRMDGGTQPRSELEIPVMEDYAELMRCGTQFPPITVFFDGKDYWLADGFHRVGAALRARPNDPIEAEVIQGTQSDAQWYSFGANKTHGLRRMPGDRIRAIIAALRHPEAANKSDREIAAHVGCHRETVAKYRKQIEVTSTSRKPASRVGRDGRTINTANIGKKQKHRKTRSTPKLSRHTTTPILGGSTPKPMITVNLPPHNPVIAAATICNLFEPPFIRTLIKELTDRMKGLES